MRSTRILYISDSIGLGHAARDLAIARELRILNAGIEIMWLAGDPARRLIAEAGETLLPETEAFAHETGVAEAMTTSCHRAGAIRGGGPSLRAASLRAP